jgi:hypothetical protein
MHGQFDAPAAFTCADCNLVHIFRRRVLGMRHARGPTGTQIMPVVMSQGAAVVRGTYSVKQCDVLHCVAAPAELSRCYWHSWPLVPHLAVLLLLADLHCTVQLHALLYEQLYVRCRSTPRHLRQIPLTPTLICLYAASIHPRSAWDIHIRARCMSQLRKAFAGLNQIDFTGLRFRLIDASGQVRADSQPDAGVLSLSVGTYVRGVTIMPVST